MNEKIKIYETTARAVLDADIPYNSEFDETLRNEDVRIVKNEGVWDIQCLTAHIAHPEPEWESIIAYPEFTSGAKMRTAFHRIQDKIKAIKDKKINKNLKI